MNMLFPILLTILTAATAVAQSPSIESRAYHWDEAKTTSTDLRERRHFLKGSTRDLEHLEMHATTLEPGHPLHPIHAHNSREELIIVKEGRVTVVIGEENQELGPGSVALIMPGDEHTVKNTGEEPAVFYILLYESRAPQDAPRGERAGGSFTMDWEDVEFRETDKGGVRSFFERPTAMFERLEMHVTTLKAGRQSHPPHTHRPAEIILMLEGSTEEQIDDQRYRGSAGDFYFLGAETLHTIRNTGTDSAIYFAFQFN